MNPRAFILVLAGLLAHPLARAAERPLLRDFIGINGHTVQFRPALYRPIASLVRDYHPVEWDLGKDPTRLPRFPRAKNGVNWSQVYGSWVAAGWRIDASLMFESVPKSAWSDLAGEARAYGRAFAQAFGPSAPRPLAQSVEVGNEPGKWSDADFATLCRGMTEGLRVGDPKLKIATCNLVVGKSTAYAKSVSCLAGLLDRFDVLTIHTYAELEGWPTWRRSHPEDPRLPHYTNDVAALCQWRDAHAPGKPVWITEFGYDACTKPAPPDGVFAKWVGSTETQQAQWLVRSLLVFSAMPVERAYIYFFNDDDTPHVHGSSGLTRRYEPKPAFYAVAHLQTALGGYRFSRIVENRAGDLRIQEYRRDDGGLAWVVWSPTGSERSTTARLPIFPGRPTRAERMPLDASGAEKITLAASREVTVTESPLYLFFDRTP